MITCELICSQLGNRKCDLHIIITIFINFRQTSNPWAKIITFHHLFFPFWFWCFLKIFRTIRTYWFFKNSAFKTIIEAWLRVKIILINDPWSYVFLTASMAIWFIIKRVCLGFADALKIFMCSFLDNIWRSILFVLNKEIFLHILMLILISIILIRHIRFILNIHFANCRLIITFWVFFI